MAPPKAPNPKYVSAGGLNVTVLENGHERPAFTVQTVSWAGSTARFVRDHTCVSWHPGPSEKQPLLPAFLHICAQMGGSRDPHFEVFAKGWV